jgi:hypothetical protein
MGYGDILTLGHSRNMGWQYFNFFWTISNAKQIMTQKCRPIFPNFLLVPIVSHSHRDASENPEPGLAWDDSIMKHCCLLDCLGSNLSSMDVACNVHMSTRKNIPGLPKSRQQNR